MHLLSGAEIILESSRLPQALLMTKEGFEVVSDELMEDGIPHVKMERTV